MLYHVANRCIGIGFMRAELTWQSFSSFFTFLCGSISGELLTRNFSLSAGDIELLCVNKTKKTIRIKIIIIIKTLTKHFCCCCTRRGYIGMYYVYTLYEYIIYIRTNLYLFLVLFIQRVISAVRKKKNRVTKYLNGTHIYILYIILCGFFPSSYGSRVVGMLVGSVRVCVSLGGVLHLSKWIRGKKSREGDGGK